MVNGSDGVYLMFYIPLYKQNILEFQNCITSARKTTLAEKSMFRRIDFVNYFMHHIDYMLWRVFERHHFGSSISGPLSNGRLFTQPII